MPTQQYDTRRLLASAAWSLHCAASSCRVRRLRPFNRISRRCPARRELNIDHRRIPKDKWPGHRRPATACRRLKIAGLHHAGGFPRHRVTPLSGWARQSAPSSPVHDQSRQIPSDICQAYRLHVCVRRGCEWHIQQTHDRQHQLSAAAAAAATDVEMKGCSTRINVQCRTASI